ncbi:MAG: hypothetical protein WC503_00605 [Candidatus Shapirobacteria bacterium]
MQIDGKVEQIKRYKIVGPHCCDEMGYLLRSSSFNSKSGAIMVGADFSVGIKYLEIRFCPFCGEKITYSETYQ